MFRSRRTVGRAKALLPPRERRRKACPPSPSGINYVAAGNGAHEWRPTRRIDVRRYPPYRFHPSGTCSSCAPKPASANPDTVADALIEAARDVLDALGSRIERGRDRDLSLLRAFARDDARIL